MSYLIKRGCSTRRVPLDKLATVLDPRTLEWLNYRPGDIVEAFPAHVPIDEWVRDGVIEPVGEAPVSEAQSKKGKR